MTRTHTYLIGGIFAALVLALTIAPSLQAKSLTMVEEKDAQLGIVSSRMPLPSSWERQKAGSEYAFTGPRGLKLSQTSSGYFPFSQNPEMNQMMQAQGHTVRPPMSINEIIETMLKPAAKEYGSRLVKQYELPEVAAPMHHFLTRLYSLVPIQRQTRSYGIEWVSDDQTHVLTVATISIAYGGYSSYWTLQIQNLESPADSFEEHKKDWLYGLSNYEVNEQWLATKNRMDAQRAQASHQQHRSRMAAIESAGRNARAIGQSNSDLLDQSHASFQRRQQMNDVGHSRSVDSIHERQVLVNPDSGQHYEVESYTNKHWLNSDGSYLGTDDVLYDPRTDAGMNDGEWVELDPVW